MSRRSIGDLQIMRAGKERGAANTNTAWHWAHRMPKNATVEEKIRWHESHAQHCGCRDSISHLRKLKARLAQGKKDPGA